MNKKEYNDLIAFHAGYYISEVIEEMEMTQEEFAKRLDLTPKHLSEIVNGKSKVTPEVANKLSVMLNTSVEMWLNLQTKYDIKIAEINARKELDEQIDIVIDVGICKSCKYYRERQKREKYAHCTYLLSRTFRCTKLMSETLSCKKYEKRADNG